MAWPTTSRHERGYGTEWSKTRLRILKRDKYLCQPCLAKSVLTPATQVDHRTPKARGGTDDEANLRGICKPCHDAKTAEENGKPLRSKVTFGLDGWPV